MYQQAQTGNQISNAQTFGGTSTSGLTSPTFTTYPYAPGPSPYDVRKDALQLCIALLDGVSEAERIIEQAKRLERYLLAGE